MELMHFTLALYGLPLVVQHIPPIVVEWLHSEWFRTFVINFVVYCAWGLLFFLVTFALRKILPPEDDSQDGLTERSDYDETDYNRKSIMKSAEYLKEQYKSNPDYAKQVDELMELERTSYIGFDEQDVPIAMPDFELRSQEIRNREPMPTVLAEYDRLKRIERKQQEKYWREFLFRFTFCFYAIPAFLIFNLMVYSFSPSYPPTAYTNGGFTWVFASAFLALLSWFCLLTFVLVACPYNKFTKTFTTQKRKS
jgi:hypothetical protein